MLLAVMKTVSLIIKCGCVAHCSFEYLGDFVVCSGASMEPTIHSGDVIMTEHISTALHNFHRGDIIISRSPQNARILICKRVVAVPGERVSGKVVPVGHLWLAGDNKKNSMDSNTYGSVPQGLVKGRAVCKIWPLNSVQMLMSR